MVYLSDRSDFKVGRNYCVAQLCGIFRRDKWSRTHTLRTDCYGKVTAKLQQGELRPRNKSHLAVTAKPTNAVHLSELTDELRNFGT